MTKRSVNCHKMIRKVAIEMAGEVYDDMMSSNPGLYAQWKAQCPDLTPKKLEIRFIEMLWPKLIEQARATLAQMLGQNHPEALKNQIYEALLLDNQLRGGRLTKSVTTVELGKRPDALH